MDSIDSNVSLKLAELGVADAAGLAPLFVAIRGGFDAEVSVASDEGSWKVFRDAWLGRKSGVLAQITDNWLKPASPELKRGVGAALNELRAHVEAKIEERRVAIEAETEESALARERVDLSLPGVVRPIGSHHLISQGFQGVENILVST